MIGIVFTVMGMAKNPSIGGGISYLSSMVAEIYLLPVYFRHFEFLELGLCQPCQKIFFLERARPKTYV
jgi:hypothetical protein